MKEEGENRGMSFQNSVLFPKLTQKKPRGSHLYSVCSTHPASVYVYAGHREKECHVGVWNQIPQLWNLLDFTSIVSGLEGSSC